jgi:hypothetical protein
MPAMPLVLVSALGCGPCLPEDGALGQLWCVPTCAESAAPWQGTLSYATTQCPASFLD